MWSNGESGNQPNIERKAGIELTTASRVKEHGVFILSLMN